MSHSVSGKPCRGVTHDKAPDATGDCAERIYAESQAPDLVALDARSGRLCCSFARTMTRWLRAQVPGQ